MTTRRSQEVLDDLLVDLKDKLYKAHNNIIECYAPFVEHEIEAVQCAILALGKQIPQKVTHEATLIRDTTCPRCKNVVGSYIDFNGVKTKVQYQYCSICGQALDWSDENEV